MYTLESLSNTKGHIITHDRKYYLAQDGHYDYWHIIKSITGDTLKLGPPIGRHAYDYCFRSNLQGCLDTLNKLIVSMER